MDRPEAEGADSSFVARRAAVQSLALVSAFLCVFVFLAYGPSLSLPFMGDDYVFLDKTRAASFPELWRLTNTDFGWYRPWSRELHFWILQHMLGPNELAFRLFGVGLWVTGLLLYGRLLSRIAPSQVAGVALVGTSAMALWGTPLLWISGSQDLWMLVFVLAALNLYSSDRRPLAIVMYAGALLSKETAAILPGVLLSYSLLIEGRRAREGIRRVLPFVGVTLMWFMFHPTLLSRLLHPAVASPELLEHRPAVGIVALRTVLSVFNLDTLPSPAQLSMKSIVLIGASSLALLGAVFVAWRIRANARESQVSEPSTWKLIGFGTAWAALGWMPLFLPSIGWHAYYGCLGALGAWLVVGMLIVRARALAMIAILAVGVLRGLHAETPSWDWGNEWYQRRAGAILEAIRTDLLRKLPVVPPHTRLYFGHIPNNIGLVAGSSPAVRVWYGDPTLEAGFYSYFKPRGGSAPPGPDLFFRFDTLTGLVQVKTGHEQLGLAQAENPNWERDHEALAMLFLKSGAVEQAGEEFTKLAGLSSRPDALVLASACFGSIGKDAKSDSLLSGAGERLLLSRDALDEWRQRLIQRMPK